MLNLYRRHRPSCEAGRTWNSTSGEFDERQKTWGKKCQCLIHASGTLAGRFSRKALETADWTEAHQRAAVYETAKSWTATRPAPSPEPTPDPEADPRPARMTFAEAWSLFVTSREADGLKVASRTAYRTLHHRLIAFATHRGYRYLDQWTIADVDRFRANWTGAPRSQRGRLFLLRAFWRFAVSREWIGKSPVADLTMPKGATTVAMKWPFTDAELERMLAACATLTVRHDTRLRGGVWSGDDLLDFIYLLVYTGLRISDATFFDMKNLQGDQVFLRAQKNGGEVFAYVPEWLATRLHARAARLGSRPFLVGVSTDSKTATELWRVRLQKVWAACGPFDHPPTPHRFRHTFVRILLQKGVTPADVAELIGDDEQTVRRHYARWVPERQARLTKILKEAFKGQATPKKFAVVSGGRGRGSD